jgi:methyl-accepting chemotaxis protein
MAEAFGQTRARQRTSLVVGLLVSAASLLLLGWFSYGVLANVRILAREVTGSAARINASSAEVLAAARQQEQASSHHASAIEETNRTVQSLSESSRSIAELAEAVLRNAQTTQHTNQEIAERNRRLTHRLQGIATILESVKDIANKSELLALNAALEGTKAGEAGRGFSLVAVQMQRLAENVMGNVRDVKRLTEEIREANHTAVLAIEEGTKLADQTTQSAAQIRLVTQQQESATLQVTESMGDASGQIRQTVAGVRQSTETTASLAELASQLKRRLAELRLSRTRNSER